MPLPDVQELERIAQERPGDEVFVRVRPYLEKANEEVGPIKNKIIELILEDMIYDWALDEAVDDIGAVLEYQAQEKSIERPTLDGKAIMRDTSRIGRLCFALKFARLIGINHESDIEAILRAEIDRLWFDNKRHERPGNKDQLTVLKMPEELNNLLKTISKSLQGRGGSRGHRGPDGQKEGNFRKGSEKI